MTKDLEYYKKQEKVFERRINLLKKEVDKLTLDKNELKQQLSMRVVSDCKIIDEKMFLDNLQENLTTFLNMQNFKGLSRDDVNNTIDLIRLKKIELTK